MNFYVRFSAGPGNRAHYSCRSWREVRRMIRLYRREGFDVDKVQRIHRRLNWVGDRTENRHGLRALRG